MNNNKFKSHYFYLNKMILNLFIDILNNKTYILNISFHRYIKLKSVMENIKLVKF